jgi:hypothetical protein
MSHDEERVNEGGIWKERKRAPRHWLNPFVGLSDAPTPLPKPK